MLPITLAVSGSTSQTRPPGPPASGLGSSTYSQPGSGLTQLSTTMFESADALLWLGALVWPAVGPACAGRAAKHRTKGTERRQNKDDRRFALIHCLRNFQVRPLVTRQGCPTILFKPEI